MAKKKERADSGRLRIGDHWNAITIIALSQSNPLKAVAEFVENSIDARAREVTIVRGKKGGEYYLRVCDDGEGIPLNEEGKPDFRHVATHICDSIKRQFKTEGQVGIQGEYGIGLLSFWTLGERLQLMCAGRDGRNYEMAMAKGSPSYSVAQRRLLVPIKGTELTVHPLLPGLRQLNGEKIQRYLAAELRDRIKSSKVEIRVIDRTGRAEYRVEPRQFSGRLLHGLEIPPTTRGEIYLELYLSEAKPDSEVGLYRGGTRVLKRITELDSFQSEPWTSGLLQGAIDAPMLNLTPGTRSGIVHDAAFDEFRESLRPVGEQLLEIIEEQRRAEEERASRQILRSVQRALREAILALPREEYDWFDVHAGSSGTAKKGPGRPLVVNTHSEQENPLMDGRDTEELDAEGSTQREFFHFAGPLYSVLISPKSSVVQVENDRTLRAICRDRSRRQVEEGLKFGWEIVEGGGRLENVEGEIVEYHAPTEPGLTTLRVHVVQGDVSCSGEALITVTASILPDSNDQEGRNNGHRDFVHASRNRRSKLRYICRLFSKELVLSNFPGLPSDKLLERMIELSMYTEESLK